MAWLAVIRPGMLTTVQDLGRWGHQSGGVPVAGPMDFYSHRLANRLVGNDREAAALEITLIGPELDADDDVLCAVCGARFEITAGGRRVPPDQPFELRKGERLIFGKRLAGVRATLAVRGGFDLPPVLGSRATSLISAMGPFGGRPVTTGAVLPVGGAATTLASTAYVPLRLPYGVGPLFEEWLTLHRPLQKEKILNRIRSIRGGRMNDPDFGSRMQGEGPYAEHLSELFEISCRKTGLNSSRPRLSVGSFRRPGPAQLPLF